ncbi:hypothetical protein BDZ89DRAFT_1076320 [Hymenopellis radicata]|nr:hypothetical protein BDZ89DRAFT_1076320 [Hymenopellis radicata]
MKIFSAGVPMKAIYLKEIFKTQHAPEKQKETDEKSRKESKTETEQGNTETSDNQTDSRLAVLRAALSPEGSAGNPRQGGARNTAEK